MDWNVLICEESVDAKAEDCGDRGLQLYSNGTLGASSQATFQLSEGFYEARLLRPSACAAPTKTQQTMAHKSQTDTPATKIQSPRH